MKTMVVYQSKYGSSKKYAEWLGKKLGCSVEEAGKAALSDLQKQDVILYVGGVYVGQVRGWKKFRGNLESLKGQKIVLCMVGLTDPAQRDRYEESYRLNVPEQHREQVQPFFLRGAMEYDRMKGLDRLMMRMMLGMLKKTPAAERTPDQQEQIDNFGGGASYVQEAALEPVLAYVRG